MIADVAEVGALKRKQVRRRGFATEREAHRALTQLLGELDAGSYVQPDLKTTLTEYVTETWLPSLVVRNRRSSTLESYRRNLEVHVLPRLGQRSLIRVTTADLDRLYADLLVGVDDRRKLAPRTVRYIHTILHGLFGHAVQKGHLAVNPCLRADAPEPKACRSRTMKTWTATQLRTFLASLDGDRFRAPLLLLATTGMRRGEALGLKWSDLRLDEGELDIVRSLGLVNDRLVVGDQKTEGGRRIVSLDPATVAALRQHRTEQVQERLLNGPGYLDEDWVFSIARRPSHASGPVHPPLRPAGPGSGPSPDPAARPSAHLGDASAESRHQPESGPGTDRPRIRRHHARSVHPRRPRDPCRRRSGSQRTVSRPGGVGWVAGAVGHGR